jgi:hypothetical protein
MSPTTVSSMAALLVVAALSGCAPEDPYGRQRPAAGSGQREPATAPAVPTSRPGAPPASGELAGTTPRALLAEPARFPAAGTTPKATLARAARLYGNWTSASAAHRLERIAALTVGQARAELRQAAAQAGTDPQQRGARGRASVEAIDLDGHGQRRRALVITRELVAAPDLPSEGWRYRITVAVVERRASKWVISRWLPQP